MGAEGHCGKPEAWRSAFGVREVDLDKRRSEVNNPKRQHKVASGELADAFLNGTKNPLDEDMSAVSPDRTSLDLPDEGHQEMCSPCGRPAVDRCPECGSPLCDDCVAGDED